MKKRYTKKRIYKKILRSIILVLIASLFAYIILESDVLSPGVDELTASYISFNNNDNTDILKITDIKKNKKQIGISNKNNSSAEFFINGDKDAKYIIVVYPIGKVIDDNYIYYYLENEKENVSKKLSEQPTTVDGGKIIYKNKINKKEKFTIRMWVDKSLNQKISPLTYEIKIKEWDE